MSFYTRFRAAPLRRSAQLAWYASEQTRPPDTVITVAMTNPINHETAYLAVDCSRSFARELSARYGALAAQCVAQQSVRVLVSATQAAKGDPTDHLALRDAVTLMLMSGLPAGFRLALVADAPDLRRAFASLARDAQQLGMRAAVCADENDAFAWLGITRP